MTSEAGYTSCQGFNRTVEADDAQYLRSSFRQSAPGSPIGHEPSAADLPSHVPYLSVSAVARSFTSKQGCSLQEVQVTVQPCKCRNQRALEVCLELTASSPLPARTAAGCRAAATIARPTSVSLRLDGPCWLQSSLEAEHLDQAAKQPCQGVGNWRDGISKTDKANSNS